jgi:protein SCO1/2
VIWRARRGVQTLALLSVVSAIVGCTKPEPPRVLRQITPFELTAQDGTSFGSKELSGTPYLVSFFFTSCSTVCPPVMEEMKSIQDELVARENPTRLISITVDPDNDSPNRLSTYAKKLGAESPGWTFLTGPNALVKEVVINRLMTHMGEASTDPAGLVDIGHGSHVLVIDGRGRLRGVHEPVAPLRDDLIQTLDILVAESR